MTVKVIRNNFPVLRRAAAAALLALPAWAPAQDDDAAVQAAPFLVATPADEPKWTSVAQLAAAEAGDPEANYIYAQHLEVGDQVEANPAAALAHYRRAAAADYAPAVFQLGKIHHDGLLGVAENQSEALRYYERAAMLGSPEATYNVGAMLVSGRGARRNYTEGLAWLLLAADLGSDPDDGVGKVRERLQRYPKTIEAAEKRYAELAAAYRTPKPEPDPKPTPPSVTPPPAPGVSPLVPARVQISTTTPTLAPRPAPGGLSIGVPKITLPAPPPPAATDETSDD